MPSVIERLGKIVMDPCRFMTAQDESVGKEVLSMLRNLWLLLVNSIYPLLKKMMA